MSKKNQSITTRRALLGLALGLCGVAAETLALTAKRPSDAERRSVRAKLQAALGLDARAVSVWFADSSWQPPSGLTTHLDLERIRSSSLSELRAHLRERIQADFDAGRIVCARGWRLAATEAAILSAIHDGQRSGA